LSDKAGPTETFAYGAIYVCRLVARTLAELWQDAERIRPDAASGVLRNRLPGALGYSESQIPSVPALCLKDRAGIFNQHGADLVFSYPAHS
jgi:hypothetical protein